MKKYFIKRFASTIPVLIGVTVLCFILMTMSGKDPAVAAAIRSNSAGDTILVDSLREEMGLDKPLPTRYFLWLKGLLNGDMGKSVVTYHSITDDIKTFFPVTFKLVIMAMGWMIIIVFSIAILCARFHGKMFDHRWDMPASFLAWIYASAAVCGQAVDIQCCSEGGNKRIYTSVFCAGISVSLRSNQGNAFVIAFRNKL